jgi:hypothetical protein
MKDLSIRQQLIHEIKFLNPELLSKAYHYIESLKATANNRKSDWKAYAGCISDNEAIEQKELINKEFENIEGEW